ncbi:MAG: carboxypeptidase regulatory-like domain-containing protein, partial [Gemmatimonadota bacterium]
MAPAARVAAQTARGSLVVTVTTQGSVRLPGATVVVASPDGRVVTTDVSDGDGRLEVEAVVGAYEVRASLSGFTDVRAMVRVDADRRATVEIDLPLAGVTERVDVIGNAETATPTIGQTLSTKGVLESRVIEQLPIRDHNVLSALKLLAGVVQGPGGVSIKGGRSNQSGLQIGVATLADTATGSPLFRLPPDAIDSVEVLPNPYAVEFGRFSSGMTVVNTKRGGDTWRVDLSAPDLSFRVDRTEPWRFTGIETFGPRIGFGGPLVKGRLFLEQRAQARFEESEIWSRPPD